jgi:outer membrane protein insertion porin family
MKSSLTIRHNARVIVRIIYFLLPILSLLPLSAQEEATSTAAFVSELKENPKTIHYIIVQGNKNVPSSAILHRLPFKPGEPFNPLKTGSLIRNLYNDLNRLRNITIKVKLIDNDQIDIYIIVEEKWPFKEAKFEGNYQVSADEINKKIDFSAVPAIDQDELTKYARIIKQLYLEKGYHLVEINTELIVNDDATATAMFHIKEHKRSMIKRILFKGNKSVSSKKLANIILTKEEWIMSLLDKTGTFIPDRLEADRHFLELLYQNNGFINAKVVDIDVQTDPVTGQLTLVYEVQEGEPYIIKEVKAEGNDILTEEQLLSALPIRPGQLYSREMIANSIQTLEMIWGNRGYAYAHIEPSIIPDDDTKTVNVSFYSDLGSKVKLNKVTIKGNKKTRDKVIRRNISLVEGQPITNYAMEDSKNRIEGLGYFDQKEGVNWKMTRLSEEQADLDLLLKEAPTGNAHIKVGIGGQERDIKSPIAGLSAEAAIADRNLFGSGIQLNASARFSKDERSFLFSLADPWLYDRPIFGKLDFYFKSLGYDNFKLSTPVGERDIGANGTVGFVTNFHNLGIFNESFVRFNLGFDVVRYTNPTSMIKNNKQAHEQNQDLLNKLFADGEFAWLTLNVGQDTKNHPIHPSRGHTWLFRAQYAVPFSESNIAFQKYDFDFNWFTPLINELDLVFHLHTFAGFVDNFKGYLTPYRELFNIGGPASVRGFLFGQIGPQFSYGDLSDSIGGKKALFWNAELIFPITPDFNLKGVFFYDGGSGWDNPYIEYGNPTAEQKYCLGTKIQSPYICHNNFDYRQSVGVGIRLYNPVPVRVDFGFKLDPRKGETPYEVHFGMAYDW